MGCIPCHTSLPVLLLFYSAATTAGVRLLPACPFLPGSVTTQTDSVRKPLVDDPDVIRWLYLARRRFEIVNTSDLAEHYGRIELPGKLAKE